MPSPQYFEQQSQLASQSCVVDLTPPTFSGVSSLTPKVDGSITAAWSAATDASPPIHYLIYIAPGSVSSGTLFALPPAAIAPSGATSWDIMKLSDYSTYLVNGATYTLGVRAQDSVGNLNTNVATLTTVAIASGNLPISLQTTAAAIAATEVLLAADHTNLAADHADFQADHVNFLADDAAFDADHVNFQADHSDFQADHAAFQSEISDFSDENDDLSQNISDLAAQINLLDVAVSRSGSSVGLVAVFDDSNELTAFFEETEEIIGT